MTEQFCQAFINNTGKCPTNARVKITRPNPVDPSIKPVFLCFSHLSSFAKNSRGQFLVTPIEGEK